MQEPFPELSALELRSHDKMVPVLPDSFMGGSAPSLENLGLYGILFPGLPKLLATGTHLVDLYLENIPHSGYISPEAMLTALSTLTSLEDLWLGFESFRHRPHSTHRPPPPLTRFVLPVLTFFHFKGDSEYMEDLVAQIDAPQLSRLNIMFSNDAVFGTLQLFQFIRRTLALKTFEKAKVHCESGTARMYLWQLSNVEPVCTSSLPPPSTPVPLCNYEYDVRYTLPVQDSIEDALWMELLLPFTAVKHLFMSEGFIQRTLQRIMPVLPDLVGRRTTEVLPSLQTIVLEALSASGPVWEGIQQFVASRQGTSRPINVYVGLTEL